MIHLADIHGKTWVFRERSVVGIHIDSPNPDKLVTVIVGPQRIKTSILTLSKVMPQLLEDIDIKY